MALPIASIPVLTGEVARQFESQAQESYEQYVRCSADEKKIAAQTLKQGFDELRQILASANLDGK
ncbi:MAG: hypothetical protein ACI391_06795 [Muribaculaceae bacterium]